MSDQAFGEALREIMERDEISYRSLRASTAEHRDKPLTISYVGMLIDGSTSPTPQTIEVISAALGIEPTHFREYRQYAAAEAAKAAESRVGLPAVLEALENAKTRTRR
jgi:hypothetical protein